MRELRRVLAPLAVLAFLAVPGPALAATSAPTVTDDAATAVTSTSAALMGTVNPNGLPTIYKFQYGTTTAYGSETPGAGAGSGTTAQPVSQALTNLAPGTTYHYRVVAGNSDGTTLGADRTFTTAAAPIVATGDSSGVGSNGATLNGTVNPDGHNTIYQFQFGTTTAYGLSTPPAGAGNGTGNIAVHQSLTGLAAGMTYHYRIMATNSKGTSLGVDRTFTTAGIPGSKVALLARTAFTSPGGVVGIGIGCFSGTTSCHGTLALSVGRIVYASRGFNLNAESGGFAHVFLSGSARAALFTHARGSVAVRLTIKTTTGQGISQVIHLVRFF